MLDFICALIAMILLSPLFVLLVIVGIVMMGGNPFFSQLRTGKDEKNFKIIKFRTMLDTKDNYGNLLPDEKRLNKYGLFLRSTSLDELPEIINILKGDMSVVGPRPLLPRDTKEMSEYQKERHRVRPGLTGMAQINGRNSLDWDTKLETDVMYVSEMSFLGDIKIVFLTILKTFRRENIAFPVGLDMDLIEWNNLSEEEKNELKWKAVQ